MKMDADLEAECRAKFAHFCVLYKASPFHVDKDRYVRLAYEQVEIYLDLRDLNSL